MSQERRRDKWREKVPNRIPLEAERDNLSEEERCHLHCEHTLITRPSLSRVLNHSLSPSLSLSQHLSITRSVPFLVSRGLVLTPRLHTHFSLACLFIKSPSHFSLPGLPLNCFSMEGSLKEIN